MVSAKGSDQMKEKGKLGEKKKEKKIPACSGLCPDVRRWLYEGKS
jgi:hypothetical protein